MGLMLYGLRAERLSSVAQQSLNDSEIRSLALSMLLKGGGHTWLCEARGLPQSTGRYYAAGQETYPTDFCIY